MEISKHAIDMALKLKQTFINKGYQLYLDSPTNQQFFVMHNDKIKELSQHVKFSQWEKYDHNHKIVRFATSWSTTENDIATLIEYI